MDKYSKKPDLAGKVAKVLNTGGGAVVSAYDLSSAFMGKVYSTVKRTPELPKKAKGIVSEGIELITSGDIKKMESQIKEHEHKLKELYYEIGKKTTKISKGAKLPKIDSVKKLIGKAKEHNKKIQALKNQIAEREEQKKAKELRKKEEKDKKAFISVISNVNTKLAVPPLIELLGDKSLKIREKALCAIKSITGQDIAVSVHASKKELAAAISNLKGWWEKKGSGRVDIRDPEKVGAVTGTKMPEFTEERSRKAKKKKSLRKPGDIKDFQKEAVKDDKKNRADERRNISVS